MVVEQQHNVIDKDFGNVKLSLDAFCIDQFEQIVLNIVHKGQFDVCNIFVNVDNAEQEIEQLELTFW